MRNGSGIISLLGGAGIGALAMFLMDPDQGKRRRQTLADAADQSFTGARSAVQTSLHDVTSQLSDVVDAAKHSVQTLVDQAHDHVENAASKASQTVQSIVAQGRGYASNASERVGSTARSIRDLGHGYASDAASRARSAQGYVKDRANSAASQARSSALDALGASPMSTPMLVTEITLGTVAIAAAGAGVMFFMDPARGRVRRSTAIDQFVSWTRRTGVRVRGFGRHLGNQIKGAAHDTQKAVRQDWSATAESVVTAVNDKIHPEPVSQ